MSDFLFLLLWLVTIFLMFIYRSEARHWRKRAREWQGVADRWEQVAGEFERAYVITDAAFTSLMATQERAAEGRS